ncbi:ferredoxin [Pengzhenrongella phosphoraccumulans]|jgi:ferredoxin|uniref:ferredoxin n=1 Tax=Pengzhenrongella phosphoraccumulans TaxID=3114394 RepID=UPI00388D7D7E
MIRRGDRTAAPAARLRIDPAACDGVGVCAHLASTAVELDRWGFPILVERDLSRGEESSAQRAVRACPRRALWIERAPDPALSWPPVDASPRP